MGSSNSLPADTRSYPPQWLPKGASEATHEQAASAVRALSAMDPERFLQVRAPLPELEDTAWGASWDSESELSVFKAHAMAAVQNDVRLAAVHLSVPCSLFSLSFFSFWLRWLFFLAAAGQDTSRHHPTVACSALTDLAE
jgi:hypothetical protein